MTQTIPKAIETLAYGRRFRSRLEARYAIFLTALGLRWQYEPEGFELESGWYLPDFFLPEINEGTWLEIKPHGTASYFGWHTVVPKTAVGSSDPRMLEFADKAGSCKYFIAYGIPEPWTWMRGFPDYNDPGLLEAPGDPFWWCICGCGKTVGIEFDGRGGRVSCPHADCKKSSHGDKGYSADHPRIERAAKKALSARFEHGEVFQ